MISEMKRFLMSGANVVQLQNRVGSERLIRSLSSHTTIRAVRHTAVS